jgi:hypothetical protein
MKLGDNIVGICKEKIFMIVGGENKEPHEWILVKTDFTLF